MRYIPLAICAAVFIGLTVLMADPSQAAILNSLDGLWLASAVVLISCIRTITNRTESS